MEAECGRSHAHDEEEPPRHLGREAKGYSHTAWWKWKPKKINRNCGETQSEVFYANVTSLFPAHST